MKKYIFGKIEFYREDQIKKKELLKFTSDPDKIVKGERRLRMKIDQEMVYIVLTGEMAYEKSEGIISAFRRFNKNMDRREIIHEISRLFYTLNLNTSTNIAKITGHSPGRVSHIISKSLMSKDEVCP